MDLEQSAARNRKHAATLQVGDRVALTRLFMASGGGRDRANWRGKIVEFLTPHHVQVEWDNGRKQIFHTFNLCKIRSVGFAEV